MQDQIKNSAGKNEWRNKKVRNHQSIDQLDHGSLQSAWTEAGYRHIV
jgi:hypothetical protein